MMNIDITVDENTLRRLVLEHLKGQLGDIDIGTADINIQVKSKRNYKDEWEAASFRASIRKVVSDA